MRIVAQPHINLEPLEACRASNVSWLAALLVWFADVLERYAPQIARRLPLHEAAAISKRSVRRDLRHSVHELRALVVTSAIARMRFTHRRGQKLYPGQTRGHAVRARVERLFRNATAHILRDMHRGSLRQRAERLAACFNDLEPLIARALKRLNAMLRTPRTSRHALVITHDACFSLAAPRAAAFADTS